MAGRVSSLAGQGFQLIQRRGVVVQDLAQGARGETAQLGGDVLTWFHGGGGGSWRHAGGVREVALEQDVAGVDDLEEQVNADW